MPEEYTAKIMTVFKSLFVLLASFGWLVDSGLPPQIKIAAIFDQHGDRKHELAFKYGVERVNRDPNILPGKRLMPEIVRIPPGNR